MIENILLHLERARVGSASALPEAVAEAAGRSLLRWYVTRVTERELVVEATVTDSPAPAPSFRETGHLRADRSVVVSIVPTGVGCSVGGYAGDAAPASNLLAATADYLVTNPNAVNASNFIGLDGNVLYTEGYAIDELMRGATNLYVPYANRVGLIVERAEDAMLDHVFNLVNTVRAVHGVAIQGCVVTERPVGTHCRRGPSGAFVGTVDRPEEVLRAGAELIAQGAEALAITTNVQDLPAQAYAEHFRGDCPNPVGGVEAIVSHLVVRRLRVPAAHAPMVNLKEMELNDPVVDARGAGEMASYSGLACVLIGLARAPRLTAAGRVRDAIGLENVVAVVAPAGCLGGVPVTFAERNAIPIVAVHGNDTILDVNAARLGLQGVTEVASYAEAAGVVLALRRGIDLESLYRPLSTLRPVRAAALMAESCA